MPLYENHVKINISPLIITQYGQKRHIADAGLSRKIER